MTVYVYGFDTSTLSPVISSVTIGALGVKTTEDFDVTLTNGQTVFQLATDITSANNLDVYVNGRLARYGASYDYQRDDTTNQITFTYTVIKDSWVRVIIT